MADDSRLSSLIDDEGRLFGLINVVDALVVLLIISVVVAGVALVAGGGGGDQETRFVTVEVTSQPGYVAEQVTVGDEWTPQGGGSFVITDVYRAPAVNAENNTQLILRARVNGTAISGGEEATDEQQSQPISFDGDPLRFGERLNIGTNEYSISGVVTAIGQTGADLPTQSSRFVMETTVDQSIADRIEVGDQFVSAGTEQLQVETVTAYPTLQDDVQRVVIGVTAQTRLAGGVTVYGDQPVQTGASISVQTETYRVTGDIIAAGSLEEPGTSSSRTVTLEVSDVTPARASAITTGATEQSQDIITAQVLSKTEAPATDTIRSGGEFQTIEHPTLLDLTLTVELSVREFQDGRVQFRGDSFSLGETITLRLDGVVVEGTIAGTQ